MSAPTTTWRAFTVDCSVPYVDFVSLQDYEDAAELLKRCKVGALPIGEAWLNRAFDHVLAKVDRYFRDQPVIRDGQQAAAYIRMFGQHLKDASNALYHAAERLRRAGDGLGARQAKEAHVAARAAAQELTGDE